MPRKAHLLLIDDDASTLASLARAFRLAGHEATVCDNAARGSELARKEQFDLILSDVVMPGIGGLALAPTLRADFLAGLPEEQVRALLPRWRSLEAQVKDDTGWQAIDLFLHAAYARLGLEKEKQAIARRFTQEHHGSADLLDEKKMAEAVEKMRQEVWASVKLLSS